MSNSLEHYDLSADGVSARGAGRHELVGYFHALKNGWRIIVPVCLLTVAAAWYSMAGREPVYTAEVLVQLSEAPTSATVAGLQIGEPLDFASQVQIIRSRAVLAAPVDSLSYQLSLGDRSADRSDLVLGVEIGTSDRLGNFLLVETARGSELRDPDTDEVLARAGPGEWLEVPGMRLLVDPQEIGPEPVLISVTDLETATERLKRRLLVEPGLGPALIQIQYTDPDPVYAAAIANAVAVAYEAYRAGTARQAAAVSKDFLAQRLAEMRDSLERVQQQLLDYQQSQGSLNPDMEGSSLMGALMDAENQLRTLRYQERLLQDLVGSLASTTPGTGMHRLVALGEGVLPGAAALYNRLQSLEIERNNLTASRFGQTSSGPQVEAIDSALARTWRDVQAMAREALAVRREQIREMEAHAAGLRGSIGAVPERTAEFARLEQQVNAVQSIHENLQSRYYEALVAEAIETGDVRIVEPALVPRSPAPVNFGLNIGIAAIFGLMLGAGGVVVRHHFDTRVKRAEQAERSADLQTVGMIPHFTGRSRTELQAAGIEAFRWLATNLNFFDSDKPLVVAVTSAAPSEGKSTVAVNLALSSAAAGRRVLLVDSDFRRPVLHGLLKAQRGPGLSEVLKGDIHPVAAIRSVESWGVDVMTCGSPVEDPTRLLGGKAFSELVERLRRHYDLVIIDTAPVLAVADSLLVCTKVDGVLFAVRANQTDQRAIVEATSKIRRMNGTLIGLVLTDVPTGSAFDRESYRYYDYGYYGTSPDTKSRKRLPVGLVGGGRTG